MSESPETLFGNLESIETEGDVEHKLLFPLITNNSPKGFGFFKSEVAAQPDIRSFTIDKGSRNKKLYFPDFIGMIGGNPFLVVEAKRPGEDIFEALRQARLYATELNSKYPAGVNPCCRLLVSNGEQTLSAAWDSDTPDVDLNFEELTSANANFANLLELNRRSAAKKLVETTFAITRATPFSKPTELLGGEAVQNETIEQNSFGTTLVMDYKHLFNPKTNEERAFIVKNAYVRSLRRDRYVDPIDRLIRAASPSSVVDSKLLDDSSKPTDLLAKLRDHKALEKQVLLLVGGVGTGKSTFVDFVREVGQSEQAKANTTWVRLDLNYAPLEKNEAYDWLMENVTEELRNSMAETDFSDIATIQKVFGKEIRDLRKGPLSFLDPKSDDYKARWVDAIMKMQADKLLTAKATSRYVCGERNKLLILVLDNCDKRTRDEQLLMFQIAQWAQHEFHCLVFLPLRDVTYDHHRDQAPLNTCLKELVFRIEPPLFSQVLKRRVTLALEELMRNSTQKKLHYTLPGGISVEYPRSDQAMYLASILKSLHEHDKIVRRIITGLAGRNIRRAMEIFLEFCTSGHIGEDEILKMRLKQGNYALPLHVVTRVLLRLNRRFYCDEHSYIKNVFQCDPDDPSPDNFVRLSILRWLFDLKKSKGPTGVIGYHRVEHMVAALAKIGHDVDIVNRELVALVRAYCIFTEHQQLDIVQQNDLISIAPAGVVHLELVNNFNYLAACSEDTWFEQQQVAKSISGRIGSRGRKGHFTRGTALANAESLVRYLSDRNSETVAATELFLKSNKLELRNIDSVKRFLKTAREEFGVDLFVGNLSRNTSEADLDAEFSKHGEILRTTLITDHDSGKSKGIAFVKVRPADERQIVSKMNGFNLGGRNIRVKRADRHS